jgi:hypothetical protein
VAKEHGAVPSGKVPICPATPTTIIFVRPRKSTLTWEHVGVGAVECFSVCLCQALEYMMIDEKLDRYR